jgi:L-threonylcarbamoyladenylate synthase
MAQINTARLDASLEQSIEAAGAMIREGKLVAFPTETVYGLGADATNDRAIAAIFAAKERPSFNPLIIHFAEISAIKKAVVWNDMAEKLAAAFWPGALSLVLARRSDSSISLLAGAGLDSLAVRLPDHSLAHTFLSVADRPIAAPSANISGAISPTTPDHVLYSLDGRIDAVLDGGPCSLGLESTVVDLTGTSPIILRFGGIPLEELEAVLPFASPPLQESANAPKSPGLAGRHYAPRLPLRLNASEPTVGEAFLAFGPNEPEGALNLSPDGDLGEAAANFFSMMYLLDQSKKAAIAVGVIPDKGLGRAINDRLRRASLE